MSNYSVDFIKSINRDELKVLPKETLEIIQVIDTELSKYFKFLLDKHNTKHNYKKNHQTDNNTTWRKNQTRTKLFKLSDNNEYETEQKEINLTLNKLNTNNFKKLFEKLLETSKTETLLSYLMENTFQKAVSQPSYCEIYVQLYKHLLRYEDCIEVSIIQNTILNKCDNYLHILKEETNHIHENHQEDYNSLCELNKKKDYIRGYSQFIGILYNNHLISLNTIQDFINSILNNIYNYKSEPSYLDYIDENLNSIHVIVKSVGNHNIRQTKDFHDNYNSYQELKNDTVLPNKVRFKCMDIIDLLK